MSATLLTIPRELRERIYEHVWGDAKSIRFTYSSFKDPFCYEAHEVRFPELPVKRYPPPGYEPPDTNARKDSIADTLTTGPTVVHDVQAEKEPFGEDASKMPIEFDLDAFLDEWADSDNEDSDADSSDEEDENVVHLPHKQEPNRRYNLESWYPVASSLFSVNHQLRNECLQYLFSTRNILLDADGVSSMRFLSRLPPIAREAITTITLGSFALLTDDKYSSAAWFGIAEEPEYKTSNGLTLITPFGAFLASQLPNLEEIYLYLPYSGTEDWYPTLAPIELSLLLKHQRIKFLNFVFLGEDVVKTLRNGKLKSRDCYERLMGRFKDCERVMEHEFELSNSVPEMSSYNTGSHQKMLEYVKRRHEFVEGNRREFAWEWGRRDEVVVGMGSDGNVQAVVRCWVG